MCDSFGSFFAAARRARGLTQWELAIRAQYQTTNISQMENGLREPRVTVAVNLCVALGMQPRDFFPALHALSLNQTPALPACDLSLPPLCFPLRYKPCPFGPLFRKVRKAQIGVTHAYLSEVLKYDKRNLGRVEKGSQEPGVFMAVRMVAALNVDLAEFFDKLYAVMQNLLTSDASLRNHVG